MDRLICKRGVSCMWDHHRLAHIHSPYLSDELDLHFIWVGGCMLLWRTMAHPKKTKILDLHGPSLASRLILHDFYTTTYTSPFFFWVHLIFYKHMLCYLLLSNLYESRDWYYIYQLTMVVVLLGTRHIHQKHMRHMFLYFLCEEIITYEKSSLKGVRWVVLVDASFRLWFI